MLSHPRTVSAGPCLQFSPQASSGEEWLHGIKHDGFRLIVCKDGTQVKLHSRAGND
jgi:ATP-dependent DNA ligase